MLMQVFFAVDALGHVVEKDSVRETEKNGRKSKVIDVNIGEKVFIPRLSLSPSDVKIPFKFQRRQFPISVSFAMTINKSQGQSLKNVGIYLPSHVFSHGQLYVAISRVASKQGLKILIVDGYGENTDTTSNVVYHEVFRNVS
jgi:ATP-dependent exoDNAse (exonuclease V) alpha subunit